MYKIISSTNSDSFIYDFSVWIIFISFSSLIAMTRSSKTMLNKNGETGHHCLVPDLKGNSFNFSPLRMMLALSLLYMSLIMFR